MATKKKSDPSVVVPTLEEYKRIQKKIEGETLPAAVRKYRNNFEASCYFGSGTTIRIELLFSYEGPRGNIIQWTNLPQVVMKVASGIINKAIEGFSLKVHSIWNEGNYVRASIIFEGAKISDGLPRKAVEAAIKKEVTKNNGDEHSTEDAP